MTFVPIQPEIIQKLAEHLTNPAIETIQWIGEASIVDSEIKDKHQKGRYILLSECCLYIFKKEKAMKKTKPLAVESLFDFYDVNLIQEEIELSFQSNTVLKGQNKFMKSNKYRFQLPESSVLATNIVAQFHSLMWRVNLIQLASIPDITKREIYQEAVPPKNRPARLLELRYIACSIARNTRIEPEILEIFRIYGENPNQSIEFKGFDITAIIPVMFCLILEPKIRNIVLDNFACSNISQLLTWILTSSSRLTSVDLRNYDCDFQKNIPGRRSANSHVTVVRFENCSCKFIHQFLAAIKGAMYTMETLVLKNIAFDSKLVGALQTALSSYHFFSGLSSLCFNSCSCESTPIIDIITKFWKNCGKKLTSLYIEECQVEVCEMLATLTAEDDGTLQRVSLKKNVCNTVATHDFPIMPQKMLMLDASECKWTTETFKAFISEICRKKRHRPLALSLAGSIVDAPWENVFSTLPYESMHEVLTDFDFSNNKMNAAAFTAFLKFLSSQSPDCTFGICDSVTRLQHLNISHCFDTDVEQCSDNLFSFFSTRELWGLEMCGIPPSPKLGEIKGLHSLNIGENELDRKSMKTLTDFVKASTTLSEIGVSDISAPEVSLVVNFYKELVFTPHLLAFDRPWQFFKKYSKYTETKRIKDHIKFKRTLSTRTDRMQLFLSLAGDFATRVAPEIGVWESTTNTSYVTSLMESTFRNPIPTLFSLDTISTGDTSVEPLAAVVTEYIATSGRHGIIPPGAPPLDPPDKEMEIPAIFATLSPEEVDGEVDPGIDVTSDIITNLSTELADLMFVNHGHVEIEGNTAMWNNPTEFLSFEPLNEPISSSDQ